MKKRILSFLLALCLVIGFVPALPAWAAESAGTADAVTFTLQSNEYVRFYSDRDCEKEITTYTATLPLTQNDYYAVYAKLNEAYYSPGYSFTFLAPRVDNNILDGSVAEHMSGNVYWLDLGLYYAPAGSTIVFNAKPYVHAVTNVHPADGTPFPAGNMDRAVLVTADDTSQYRKSAFKATSAYKATAWKYTRENTTDDLFTNGATYPASVELTHGYDATQVTVGHKKIGTDYISSYGVVTAMITDFEGRILYYGSVNTDSGTTESTATIPAGLAAGEYTLTFRAEKWNGVGEDDVAMPSPIKIPITVRDDKGYKVRPSEPVIQLGTSALEGYSTDYGYDTLWYGKGNPIPWLVLDSKSNTGSDEGVFVLSKNLVQKRYTGTNQNLETLYTNGTGLAFSGSGNTYQGSDIHTWVTEYLSDDGVWQSGEDLNISYKEKAAMLAVTKSDPAGSYSHTTADITTNTYTVSAVTNILNNDKMFLLSYEEVSNPAYGLTNASKRKAVYYDGDTEMAAAWWLRSPVTMERMSFIPMAALIGADGELTASPSSAAYMKDVTTQTPYGVRPAFNLKKSEVIFTHANDLSAQVNFGEVQKKRVSEWKVTVKDEFAFPEASLDKTTVRAGESISLSHGALKDVSSYTNLTAALTDMDGNLLYYGSLSTDMSETVTHMTVPHEIPDGTYTLTFYAEIWKTGETNYASGVPYSVTLTVTSPAVCEIDETTFPDAAFRSLVLSKIDTSGDGILSEREAAIVSLSARNRDIESMKGVEYFTNLRNLVVCDNKLTSLDVSALTALTGLDCSDNLLTSLDISANTELALLSCGHNQLTSLNVSANAKLADLTCVNNQLTSLDLSSNGELFYLDCSGNLLTSLDVSANQGLVSFFCEANQLTSLDLSRNQNLMSDYEFSDGITEYVIVGSQTRSYQLGESRLINLFHLGDYQKMTNFTGGTVSNHMLTVSEGATQVTYDYDVGFDGKTMKVTLNLIEPPVTHLAGYSLSLDGDIGVNFYMTFSEEIMKDETANVEITSDSGGTENIYIADSITEGRAQTVGGRDYYVFSYRLDAKEMTETIRIRVRTATVTSAWREFTVRDYAQYILDHANEEAYAPYVEMVKAMLNYGAAAQTYFGYRESDFANASLSEADKVVEATEIPADLVVTATTGTLPEGLTFEGSTLMLETTTRVRYYFRVAEGTDPSVYAGLHIKEGTDLVYAQSAPIYVYELADALTCTVGDFTVTYSPLSYAAAALESETATDELKALCLALYEYYAEAAKLT